MADLTKIFSAIQQVWVLTGDKLETAVNIAFSCGHFKRGMELLTISKPETVEEILQTLQYSHFLESCYLRIANQVFL